MGISIGFLKALKIHCGLLLGLVGIFGFAHAEENRWTNQGPGGAVVMNIAINPINRNMIYVGVVGGNLVYGSIDSGVTWTAVSRPGTMSNTAQVLAVHPNAPETIYVATMHGIFKTENRGMEWSVISPPGYPYNDYGGFLMHPTHPNVLYTANNFGSRYKSIDGGRNWYEFNTSGRIVAIEDFAVDPNNDSILYFTSGSMRFGLGVWKSTDMGENWFVIQNNMDSAGTGESVVVDPHDSNIIYVTKNAYDAPNNHCVYKSADAGTTWQGITPPTLTLRYVPDIDILPSNHNVLFICSNKEGVFKSEDAGLTWRHVNDGLQTLSTKTIEIDSVLGIIYLGTIYDGIYKSTDEGESWQKISQGINLSTFWGLAFSPSPNTDINPVGKVCYQSSDSGRTWSYFAVGIPPIQEVSSLEIDRVISSQFYIATIHALTGFPFNDAGFFFSADTGTNWEYRGSGLPGNLDYWDMAISYIDSEARRIFLASDSGLYYSDNLGQNWSVCQNGLPVNDFYYKVGAALSNDSVIAAGNYDCVIYISSDRGESWLATSAVPGAGYLRELVFDPTNENILYVSNESAGLFKSTNRGASWANITNNIPPHQYLSIGGLAINPENPQNLMVCSRPDGVFQSHNGGDSWETLNEGIDTSISAGQLAFFPGDTSKIIFASANRSIWSIYRTSGGIGDGNSTLPDNFSLTCYPNPFNQSVLIQYNLPYNTLINLDIYDIMGRKIQRLIGASQSAGAYHIYWNADDVSSGIYLARLQADGISKIIKLTLLK
jgi:photosystem II stability/assembly factor-like uncharacterized protein